VASNPKEKYRADVATLLCDTLAMQAGLADERPMAKLTSAAQDRQGRRTHPARPVR